jgi:FlaA1/EpsC-like NDP-sugar epimerase
VVSNKGKRVEVNCIDEGIYEKDKMPYIYKNMMFDENFSSPSIIQSACTKLIRTSILKKCISYVDNCITYGDDAAIVYRCILNSDSIAILNKGLYDNNRLPEQTMCTSEDINRFTGIQVFYKSMHQYFKDYDAEYNLQSQLNNYVVHLIEMALRNNLGFRGISSGNCIPFNAFTNAKNIALYGAGKIGKEYYNQLMSCETIHVTTWVDKNLAGECIMGRQIDPLDKLKENDYDLCLIAVAKEEMADEIRNEIIHYTDEKKIVWQKPVRAKSKLIFDLD